MFHDANTKRDLEGNNAKYCWCPICDKRMEEMVPVGLDTEGYTIIPGTGVGPAQPAQ